MRIVLRCWVAALILCSGGVAYGQAGAAGAEPFKLGTVRYQGRTFTALVVRDTNVVDLAAAAKAAKQTVPGDLLAIIEQYESGVGDRLKAIVRDVAGKLGAGRPAYVYDLKAVDVLVPFEPKVFLNGAGNYYEHRAEMSGATGKADDPSLPGIWERASGDTRQNPYLFLSPGRIVIGDGDAIQVPLKRTNIDYECELLAIVGKPTRRVSVARARDYIWGYSEINDVSDRGGRSRDSRGSDWFVGKGQDTFKPFGPFLVSREFIDPLNTNMRFVLSGRELQNDNTKNAIHNIYELVHYASNILTLRVGDVVALGTPPGVGNGRKPPIWMKAGDTAACTYEGIGTLTNPVVAEQAPTSSASR